MGQFNQAAKLDPFMGIIVNKFYEVSFKIGRVKTFITEAFSESVQRILKICYISTNTANTQNLTKIYTIG